METSADTFSVLTGKRFLLHQLQMFLFVLLCVPLSNENKTPASFLTINLAKFSYLTFKSVQPQLYMKNLLSGKFFCCMQPQRQLTNKIPGTFCNSSSDGKPHFISLLPKRCIKTWVIFLCSSVFIWDTSHILDLNCFLPHLQKVLKSKKKNGENSARKKRNIAHLNL